MSGSDGADRRRRRFEGGGRLDALLFNETQSRIVISVPAGSATAVLALLEWRGVPARRLGVVGGRDL
jgi:hypothetical protein